MRSFLFIAVILVGQTRVGYAELPVPNTLRIMGWQNHARQQAPDEIPRNSVPQNFPCIDQAKSLSEVEASFNRGRAPSRVEASGSWVAIGFVGSGWSAQNPSFNCDGVKRGKKFEWVMLANEYRLEIDAIGMTYAQSATMKPDGKGGVSFAVDFSGDALPVYRCRLTQRKTLACLVAIYGQGLEFKKMSVSEDQIFKPRPVP